MPPEIAAAWRIDCLNTICRRSLEATAEWRRRQLAPIQDIGSDGVSHWNHEVFRKLQRRKCRHGELSPPSWVHGGCGSSGPEVREHVEMPW